MIGHSTSRARLHTRWGALLTTITLAAALVVLPAGAAGGDPAVSDNGPVCLEFDTELVSLDLTGEPIPMPLASDPGNELPDSVDG